MSRANVRRHVLLENKVLKEREKTSSPKHLKRIYPIGLHKSTSSLSLSLSSSLSLSLSENSYDSSLTDSSTLDQKISAALRFIAPTQRREYNSPVAKVVQQQISQAQDTNDEELKRCNWITKNSGKFHCFITHCRKLWFLVFMLWQSHILITRQPKRKKGRTKKMVIAVGMRNLTKMIVHINKQKKKSSSFHHNQLVDISTKWRCIYTINSIRNSFWFC